MAPTTLFQRAQKDHQKMVTSHASLCALAPVLTEKRIFAAVHDQVKLPQKTMDYRPSDKLVFASLGLLAGAKTVFDLNQVLRPNRALLKAFGYDRCADQSVIQDTLNAATPANVTQLEGALKTIWQKHNRTARLRKGTGRVVTVDLDLSGQPASKRAEKSKKGYFPGPKNVSGRQLARVLVPATQEIVTEALYPGDTPSCRVFKTMIQKMEPVLGLKSRAQRRSIRLRIDAGFGTDANLNYALWRGYQLLAKIYSSNRVKKLARSVIHWQHVPSAADHTPRQAGWVTKPHRYGRKTRQIVIRTPKKDGAFVYHGLVCTDLKADLATLVTDYDGRSGVPESTFCQDSQGLANRKRRKRSFVAQQMLTLLNQLAHNLIIWIKQWLLDALSRLAGNRSGPSPAHTMVLLKTIQKRGIKRFMQQVLAPSGLVFFQGGKVVGLALNPLYPLIDRFQTAFQALLQPYGIQVSLHEI